MTTKKVLIIEDDTYTRDIYEEILTDAGFSTETASDGQEGLVKAQQGGYDLILLDVMMPKMNGIQVLEHLKNEPPHTANGKIILLTNLGHESVIEDALSKGASSYMVKSAINPDVLIENIKKLLS